MFATVMLAWLLFVLPGYLAYRFLWGGRHYLIARSVPVEANGEVYMVRTRCRNALDFGCELYIEHMGTTLPLPGPEGYRVNGERI